MNSKQNFKWVTMEKNIIEKWIGKYKSIFAKDKYDIGSIKDYLARIDLIIDRYCSKRTFRCTVEDQKQKGTQVAILLEKMLLKESYGPFAGTVTLENERIEKKIWIICWF